MSPHSNSLNSAIELFGKLSATELELAATIHFVNELEDEPSQSKVVNIVHSLKPKFYEGTIEYLYKQLEEVNLIR